MTHIHRSLNTKIRTAQELVKGLLDGQNKVACSTKFSADSCVFLHLISSIDRCIPVIWVNTGYNHRDTLVFAKEVADYLDLNLHIFEPQNHIIQIPPTTDDPAHQYFTEVVKLAPFRQAITELGVSHWVSSIRAYQTSNRGALPKVLKLSDDLTKLHPMLDWTKEDMSAYRELNGLPLGPEPYDPTKGDVKRECGLHEARTFF